MPAPGLPLSRRVGLSSTCTMPSGSLRRRGALRVGSPTSTGESPIQFAQFGINVKVLEPGQSSVYHAEANQDAFLVLVGECRLLVEGEERLLRAWDFFHSPPWTEHAFVGAGDAPCVVPTVGAHVSPEVRYPVSGLLLCATARVWRKRHPIRSRYMRRPSVSGESAVVLVTAALGLEPFAVAVRRHSRTLEQGNVLLSDEQRGFMVQTPTPPSAGTLLARTHRRATGRARL